MGHTRRRISVAPEEVSWRRRNQSVERSSESSGKPMSDLSPATHRLNAGNKRGVRPRIEAAAMRTAIVVLAQLVFYGSAMAGPEYAVDNFFTQSRSCDG